MSGTNTATSIYIGVDDGDDSDGRLTFGVEIEFLCPVVPQGGYDAHAYQDDRRVAHEYPGREEGELVLSALQRIPSIAAEPRGGSSHGLTYDSWLFHFDDSLHLARSDPLASRYTTDGCEVISEVLCAGDAINKVKMRAVCAAIRSERVLLNDTTSVHVHVGRGTEGFSLLTIKKLTSLLWLIDGPLMYIQHPSRSESQYCRKITKHSRLAFQASQRVLPDDLSEVGLLQMVEHLPLACRNAYEMEMARIWGAKSTEELRSLTKLQTCDYTVRGSVTYQKLDPRKLNTVEFRQMGGSLDPDVIMSWAELCVAITDFARTADAPSFRFMMVDMMDLHLQPLDCAVELMRRLGLSKAAMDYYVAKNKDYYEDGNWTYFEGQERGGFVPPLPDSS